LIWEVECVPLQPEACCLFHILVDGIGLLRLQGAQERRSARLMMRSGLAAASSIRPSLDAARS
jgi:hypothetical protein